LLQKFEGNFVALTFALIVPVRHVLHRVSCTKKMIQNAPKHNETHQNMSLGSNAMNRVHLLQIIPNAPKHYETRQNMSLGSYGLVWVRSLRKIPTRLRRTNFWTKCTSSARFAPSFTAVIKQSQMHLNTMKRAKT